MREIIKVCKSFDDLYNLWIEEQLKTPAIYLRENIPSYSFLPDGIICNELYEKSETKILFVGKEANWFRVEASLEENKKGAEKESLYFWHREVAYGNVPETMFSKRLAMLVNAIKSNDYMSIDKNHEGLKEVAFINLNKRGGYSYCIWETLDEYVKQYAEYIEKEIQLISPDIVVCCGKDVEWLINKHLKGITKEYKVISISHPSYWTVSDAEYLDQLKCAINGEEWVCEKHQTRKDQSIPIKGIIFDTNKTYSEDAMFEMLTSNKISAYGDASRFVDSFNVGDYAFYYEKGKGIVAVGRILSDTVCLENSDDREKFREVKIVVPSVIPYNDKELCAISAAELKKLVGHGFYFASTTKRPYLSEEESIKITNRLEALYEE